MQQKIKNQHLNVAFKSNEYQVKSDNDTESFYFLKFKHFKQNNFTLHTDLYQSFSSSSQERADVMCQQIPTGYSWRTQNSPDIHKQTNTVETTAFLIPSQSFLCWGQKDFGQSPFWTCVCVCAICPQTACLRRKPLHIQRTASFVSLKQLSGGESLTNGLNWNVPLDSWHFSVDITQREWIFFVLQE